MVGYSTSQDAAYCLCCYLFKPDIGDQSGGDTFVGVGFKNWKCKKKLEIHVGFKNWKCKKKLDILVGFNHYWVDLFIDVIDKQLTELNDRFTEKNIELLLCVACLSPSNSFSAFDKEKLMRLAQFYPSDFSQHDLELLKEQLENYIWDMTSNSEFADLKGISDLAQKMVGTKKDQTYQLVYLLLTLALILPVATASVERVSFCYEHC